jgi:hypothetical protein
MTFEEFLKDCMAHGHTQVKLVPHLKDDGVYFYATGQCGHSTCADFNGSVKGDAVGGPPEVVTPKEPRAKKKKAGKLTPLEVRADEEAEAAREITGLAEGDFGNN